MTIARVFNTGSQPNVFTGAEQAADYVTAKTTQTENDTTLPQEQTGYTPTPAKPKERDDDDGQSSQDLTALLRAAQGYQTAPLDSNETRLALDAAVADMKTDLLIQRGLVSDQAAQQLLDDQERGHALLLDRMDAYLAQRETASVRRGDPSGVYPPADRALFQSMYDAVLQVFHNSGGDAPAALRAAAFHGQAAIARAGAAAPMVQRWGITAEGFWKNFFSPPPIKHGSAQWKAAQALTQMGQSVPWANSAYQNYINDWRDFLAVLDGQGAYLVDAQA